MNQPLPPLPPRIARLPKDHRGFPIPWFVAVVPETGERDFRVADGQKRGRAVGQNLCWVCGEKLGQYKAFVIGPMCAVNLVTSEPPCHLECAEFSAMACPFLTRPKMRRNVNDLPNEADDSPGIPIDRNPGVACIWVCKSYTPFDAGGGGWLIRLGAPATIIWFAEGKPATQEQVLASITSGYPILLAMAEQEGSSAVAALAAQRERALKLLPAA
jgi:hypothetical protein